MENRIILPGDGGDMQDGGTPDIVFDPTVIREITDTTLADATADKATFNKQLSDGAEDLGDGFLLHPEPVLVRRGPDGEIAQLIPLSEIPGAEMDPVDPVEVDGGPKPVPLTRDQRYKLREVFAARLMKNYMTEGSMKGAAYNPVRDGIPELPAGSPQHLQPIPGTPLYPATPAQVYEWLMRFVADRFEVLDKQKFGGGHAADIVVRIK